MNDRPRVIDGDGHVQEDSSQIVEFLPPDYRDMALETPRSVGLVPPIVGLFPTSTTCTPASATRS